MEFQLLNKTKMLKNKDFLAFKLSDVVFTMLINVQMPTTVKSLITLGPGFDFLLFIFVEDIEDLFGPCREKTCLRGFRLSEFQTSLLSYRD